MELPILYDAVDWTVRRQAREQYAFNQGGLCCHCKAPLTGDSAKHIQEKKINKSLFPGSFFDWPVHLHHCRKSGLTIGAVHNLCNAVLWQYHGE